MGFGEGDLHLPVRLTRLEPLHRLRQPGDLNTQKAPGRKLPQSRGACELQFFSILSGMHACTGLCFMVSGLELVFEHIVV